MEFRILGPLEVFDHGRPLEVGVGKQRALLALLLLSSGEVVSTDRLIDVLWEERPPASALNSVHIYVSQLRKVLGDGQLETRGHGYLLALEPEQLDLGRFEHLLVEGRALLAGGEPERAAEALRTGLALWRGPPLSDFASEPFAHGEIARLEELHLAALEERIEADLAVGRDGELVPELEALIREHPLRERLRAQLMLALYRSGRQAEALDAYRQARRMLADELGLEPGRTLQELEGAILRQDSQLDPPSRAATPLGRTRRRGGVLVAIGAALLLSAAIAVASIELTGGDSPGLSSASANSVAAIDARSNRLVAEVPVGNGPTSVAVGAGSVWVTNANDRSVSRIDPRTSGVQRIDVGGDPSGIAFGAGAIWVANSLDGTVSRIDPQTNREVQPIPVGVTPTALAVGDGSVWVTSAEERSVTRIDVVHGRVVERIPTGALGRGIAVGGGSVWITDESSRSVVRLDSKQGRRVRRVGVGNGPTGIAVGHGSVWVANSLDGTVSRIDPRANRVTDVIPVGEGPDGIAVGSGVVWVSGEFSKTIARIDPAENRVTERIPIANRPRGLALLKKQVWVAVQASGSGHRGGRLVVGAGKLIQGSVDPTFLGWAGTITSLSTVFDGLVGPARRGGSEGTQIVPNLARSLPEITAGRTRYAFQLRRGVRYSNGTLVKASDFRRAFERALRHPELGWDFPLVGVDACKRRPRSCDLSQGIRTNDLTGTIVFHLRRPEGQFLRTLFLVPPIPRSTPERDTRTRPVPSTGPYMIESYVPRRALTLVRNPYFRVRSKAARPDGFPDEIEFRLGPSSAGVTAVERGRVDIAFVPSDRKNINALEDFKARYASRFHRHGEQATVLLFLNTTHPPFDDVRVRRAVNYAVDRAAISASYGTGFAQPTCQLRPPGTVGFRPYCPYTAAPSKTGEWKAPDLARARRLVAASGTRGMSVTVWTYPGFWEQAAAGAVHALDELGYRASIRRAEGYGAYFAKVADEKTRGVQAGVTGWYDVPRTASSLLTLFRCSPPDNSFFCDRRVDLRITRALEIEATDPDAAVAVWAKIERDIVDLAPWVPLFTPSHVYVASKRVGNYQYNPESRLLFDQLWVR
jgi:peptide/nickel transport system substrate-binding protein